MAAAACFAVAILGTLLPSPASADLRQLQTDPASPELAEVHAQVEGYLEARIGPLPDRPLQVSRTAMIQHGRYVEGWTDGRRIVVSPDAARGLVALGRGVGCFGPHSRGPLLVLAHESAHLIHGGPWWAEEGFTQAVVEDHDPGLWRSFCGSMPRMRVGGIYPTRVRWARSVSAVLTGARPGSPAARAMRLRIHRARDAERHELIGRATAILAAR